MAKGWIRAWTEETTRLTAGDFRTAKDRSTFRKGFTTPLRKEASAFADVVATLRWGDEVELPNSIQSGPWTNAIAGGQAGFVLNGHLVEVAYVKAASGKDAFTAPLVRNDGKIVRLLWGDLVQITKRSNHICEVRARGMHGTVDASRLTSDPLLELYFVDVVKVTGFWSAFRRASICWLTVACRAPTR